MSDNQNPVAWHVTGDGFAYATLLEEHARAIVQEDSGTGRPLYQPVIPLSLSPTLTDEERTAIEGVIEDFEHDGEPASAGRVATLRGLLEKHKGGER